MKWRLFLFPVVALLFMFVLLAEKASAESVWDTAGNPTFTSLEFDPNDPRKLNCEVRQLAVPHFTKVNRDQNGDPIIENAEFTYHTQNSDCFTKNALGYIAGAYLSSSISGPTVRFDAGFGELRFAPGDSQTMIHTDRILTPGRGGFRISINYNPLAIAKPAFGYNSSEFVLRTTPAPFEKNADGSESSIIDRNYKFSSNGRFILARMWLPGSPLAKIDLYTKTLTLIASTGLNTSAYAISDDGRYVLSSHSGLKMYDLEGCSVVFQKGSWPSTYTAKSLYDGCSVKDLYTAFKASQPNGEPIDVRFNADGRRVVFDIHWRDNNRQGYWRRVTMASPSYQPPQGYLAMGDSFASGEGDNGGEAGWYEKPTDTHMNSNSNENLCHLSSRSYPYLAAKALELIQSSRPNDKFHSVACSGAQTSNIVGGWKNSLSENGNQYSYFINAGLGEWTPGNDRQISYLHGKHDNFLTPPFSPEAISISIGGNDINLIGNLKSCLFPLVCELSKNQEKRSEWALEIANLKPKLVSTYKKLKEASPNSRIYVLGYPITVADVLDSSVCANNIGSLSANERQLVLETQIYLNAVIEAATKEAGVFYVDVENILEGQNLCSGAADKDMTVNGVNIGDDKNLTIFGWSMELFGNESFHPNENAQPLYRDRLLSQTANLTKPMPTPIQTPTPTPNIYFGSAAIEDVQSINQKTILAKPIREYSKLIKLPDSSSTLKQLKIKQPGLAQNSVVELGTFSTYRKLGNFTTNSEGVLETTINLPNDLEPGPHEIHVYGRSMLGEQVDYYDTFWVAGPDQNDVDADGIPNDQDKCTFLEQSNTDEDRDGIDDGCDAFISTPTDTTPPQVAGAVANDEKPNTAGWYNRDITINWTSTDAEPSSGAPNSPESTLANLEGENVYTSSPSCDAADNCSTGNVTLKIDKSRPLIRYSYDHEPNLDGWSNRATTITFECDDTISGIASCSQPQTFEQDGVYVVSGEAEDNAGNKEQISVIIKLDSKPPIISYSSLPSANSKGWNNSSVDESYLCNDEFSGLVSCPDNRTLDGEGVYNSQTVTISDMAGNAATIQTNKIMIDMTAPNVVGINWSQNPISGGQTTLASSVFTEDMSGLESAIISNGLSEKPMLLDGFSASAEISLSASGIYEYTFFATDNAGNRSSLISDFLVVTSPPNSSIKAKHPLVQLQGSSQLPGITDSSSAFGIFEVNAGYDAANKIGPGSGFNLGYASARNCLVSTKVKPSCNVFKIASTTVEWIADGGSSKIIKGRATLQYDGQIQEVFYVVRLIDGQDAGLGRDLLEVKLFSLNDNPLINIPKYQLGPIELPLGSVHISQ
ncbi:MAG: SGNH/GDSL hydrolase family protein [bacterium]|nr:SGNH/GDSL hydrolase family protein [bacterium]